MKKITMRESNVCPECGNDLTARAKRCSCGWFKPQARMPVVSDFRCEYTVSQRRCPLPGTLCPYPYGKGTWYCFKHWRVLDDPRLGEAELRDAEENYHEIMEARKDWRRKLF
jgi:hypothetical protein